MQFGHAVVAAEHHVVAAAAAVVGPALVSEEGSALAQALSEEGIPASAHYIGKPIFLYDLLRSKQVFGASHCPWDCPRRPVSTVRYEPGACPQTEKALDDLVVLPMNEKFTEQDVRDLAAGIHKVVEALPDLRQRGAA